MILKGKNVNLRPIKESDFNKYLKWHNDENIRFLAVMHPYTVTERQERLWFEKAIKNERNDKVLFSVDYMKSKELIGYFHLSNINMESRNASLGIVIGEIDFQGKSLGKEIMQIGIKYGFEYLGLTKIYLDVVIENEKALRLYKKLGFIKEGKFIKHFFFKGGFHDIVRMALIKK